MKAYLGLGSNLGDRGRYLHDAVEALRELDASLAVSPVYETAPVGGPQQGPYLNCVVRLEADLDPFALLEVAHRLEGAAGRLRGVKDGPRTLDVDILLIEGVELVTPELTVPHPRMYERGFVLAPLEDLDAGVVPVGWRRQIAGAGTLADDVRRVGTIEETAS
ncbi:MAG: 2-amino-4-hydroxy-6-hydroxymethyldihydropteridine diphosphokinase [Acidimicrobiales bacterium]